MKKFLIGSFSVLIFTMTSLFFTVMIIFQDPEFGGNPKKERKLLLNSSKNFKEDSFQNTVKKRNYDFWVNIREMMGDQIRRPPGPFPLIKPKFDKTVSKGLRAIWFGHASVLVEIDGYRVFFDPMLSEAAFPVNTIAPKRMNPPPMKLKELPKIDAVIISHDHFDHLDMKSVKHLDKLGAHFFVGLGVGAHLEKWKIKLSKITELDWGGKARFKGLTIHCTEARHYSGRKSMSNDSLWTSWVVKGPDHSVFHSGDTGFSPHFKKIGERFPGIDLSLIKVGDYGMDLGWQDIHMIPENSIRSHKHIGAKIMLPIHWGVFQLSYHPWNEPIERTVASAKKNNIKLITPKIGETIQIGKPIKNEFWWRSLKKPKTLPKDSGTKE